VIYKILTTINLAETLTQQFSKNHFVPVYWMATEDHDFEEINHFWVKNQKIQWNNSSSGAVGEFETEGLNEVLEEFKNLLGFQKNAKKIIELFEQSYSKHANLAEANRFLMNELFGEFGLVIIDGNDKALKNQFTPYLVDELKNQTCEKEVSLTNSEITKEYKIQVNPRQINLFYLTKNQRKRIVFESDKFKVLDTNLSFSKKEISNEINEYPERFSPNVLMRPLYQEVILPNLGYVGGAGELAYWLQLKNYFDQQKVPFPILLHRNSALILSQQQRNQLDKLKLDFEELFLPLPTLINKKIKDISVINIDFSKERESLKSMFLNMEIIAEKTDKSFIGAVKAQHQKQINGLDKLEKRLLKAEKRKHQAYIIGLTLFYSEIFPKGILQERKNNISEFILQNENSISELKVLLNPLSFSIDILSVE
jgi:bacillithiol biosynthesis cysteine-adding enzyme BshC